MSSNIVGYVLAVGLLGSAAQAAVECPDSSRDGFIADSVQKLAGLLPCPPVAQEPQGQLAAQGPQGQPNGDSGGVDLKGMISDLRSCWKPKDPKDKGEAESAAGDLTDALLLKNYNVFSVVRDTIFVCGQNGKGREVAALVASRALMVKGQGAKYLIDAGVLAAAAKMAETRREAPPTGAAAPTSGQQAAVGGNGPGQLASSEAPTPVQPDLERERLERMMEKGLLTDEYRAYIDERNRHVNLGLVPEPSTIANTDVYQPNDIAIYAALYDQALIGSGYLDRTLDQRADPGGYASVQ